MRKAHYARPADQDLPDAMFPVYSLTILPMGKGAGSGNKSAASAKMVFVGCQSKSSIDDGNWPIPGDSHTVALGIDELKEVHKEINRRANAGTLNGLLGVMECFEEASTLVEHQQDGDYNPLFSSIAAGSDIELAGEPE